MTNNEKLARWQGWNREKNHSHWWRTPAFELVCRYPDYLNDDAAAMSLLDTLVEKGYLPELVYLNCKHWQCEVWKGNYLHAVSKEPTRREAVVAACLELIEKENTDDPTR